MDAKPKVGIFYLLLLCTSLSAAITGWRHATKKNVPLVIVSACSFRILLQVLKFLPSLHLCLVDGYMVALIADIAVGKMLLQTHGSASLPG